MPITYIKFEGKTLNDALESAAKALNIAVEEIKYHIEDQKKSIFGEKTIIKVEAKKEIEECGPEIHDFAKNFFSLYFSFLETEGEVEPPVFDNNYALIKIVSSSDMLFLNNQAELLLACQKILNSIGRNYLGFEPRIVLDCKDYRKKRAEILEKIALNKANEVKRYKKIFAFKPLEPYERKLIHIVLQDNDGIYTQSEGTNFYKKLKIIPKKN